MSERRPYSFVHCAFVFQMLLMEQCEQSLCDMIEARKDNDLGPYPVEFIKKVAVDVANALKYLHASCVLHGDIKSGNVLVKSTRCRIFFFFIVKRYGLQNCCFCFLPFFFQQIISKLSNFAILVSACH